MQETQKIIRVMNAVAAGVTSQTSSAVDMTGWDSVEFVALLGSLTVSQVTKLKAAQSSDDAGADDYTDLAGSATAQFADAHSNKLGRLEINRPLKRYVKCTIVRGTANAVIDGMIAILRRARKVPIAQDASVAVSKSLNSPAEGTA